MIIDTEDPFLNYTGSLVGGNLEVFNDKYRKEYEDIYINTARSGDYYNPTPTVSPEVPYTSSSGPDPTKKPLPTKTPQVGGFFKKLGEAIVNTLSTIIEGVTAYNDNINGTNFSPAVNVLDATIDVASVGSDFKRDLKSYTKDVLNYNEENNIVMKFYEKNSDVYTDKELEQIKNAKKMIMVNSEIGTVHVKVNMNLYAKDFTDSEIEQIALVMYGWDPKAFSEIYNYTGISRRLP